MEIFAAILMLACYLIPTIIAFARGHASKWAIFAMNFLLGWAVIFWFWSFFWSLSNKGASQNVTIVNNLNNSSN